MQYTNLERLINYMSLYINCIVLDLAEKPDYFETNISLVILSALLVSQHEIRINYK